MKIKKSQLRKIILESLIVEAISVEQAEAKLEKEKMKIWKSMIFVMKRDGVDAVKNGAKKYDYVRVRGSAWDRENPFETKYYDGIPYGVEHTTEEEIFTNIDTFVPEDVSEDDRSNSILWLIKQFKSDLGLFFALTEEARILDLLEDHNENMGEVKLTNKVRNSLEKFGQFKHIINPPEKRDLFRIKDMQELFSIVEAHEEAIDAENKRLGSRISGENVIKGFIPLRGELNIAGENMIRKNTQTGFYTKPDSEGIVIGEIHSKAAAIKLGIDTDWCTAAPGLSFFDDYYETNDPLIYIEIRGSRYQFSYHKKQFMDINDEPVSREIKDKLSNIVWKALTDKYGSAAFNKFPAIGGWALTNIPNIEIKSDQIMELLDDNNIRNLDRNQIRVLAKHPATTDEGLKKIASSYAGKEVLWRKNISNDVLKFYVDYRLKYDLLTDDELAFIFKEHKDLDYSFYLIDHPEVYKHLTHSEMPLDDNLIEYIMVNGNDGHQKALIYRGDLPAKYIRILYNSYKNEGKSTLKILDGENVPEDILADAFKISDIRYHTRIASNPKTPAYILLAMAKNSPFKNTDDLAMRIVNHPNLTKEIYNIYIDRAIKEEVTYRVSLTASRYVRERNPVIDLDIIEKIYQWKPKRGQRLKDLWNNPAIYESSSHKNRWLKIAGLLD